MIVSLLQAHVLDAILDFFIRGKKNPLFADFAFNIQINKLDKICNVQDSKFESFLLILTKRSKAEEEEKGENNSGCKLSLKAGLTAEVESLDEAELKKRIKIMQYEAMIVTDIK